MNVANMNRNRGLIQPKRVSKEKTFNNPLKIKHHLHNLLKKWVKEELRTAHFKIF